MNSEKRFTVKNAPTTLRACIFLIVFFAAIELAYTLFSTQSLIPMYICITIFVHIPLTIVALWTGMYRIKVNDMQIQVRKSLGFEKFNLEISDIRNVDWSITDTKFGQIEGLMVYKLGGKKFIINDIMINSDKFKEYIKENVEADKINKTYKTVG